MSARPWLMMAFWAVLAWHYEAQPCQAWVMTKGCLSTPKSSRSAPSPRFGAISHPPSPDIPTDHHHHQAHEKPSNNKNLLLSLALGTLLSFPLATPALDPAALSSPPTQPWTPSVFNHDYADPFHPGCRRHIQVALNGQTFHYSGTAVGPKNDPVRRGCSPEEIKTYKLRRGAFDGQIIQGADGRWRVTVGDGIHEGVWEPAGSVSASLPYSQVDGIRWDDGNKWTVIPPSAFTQFVQVVFIAYLAFSTGAGAKWLYERLQQGRT